MGYIVLIDFGSTFTKATVVSKKQKKAIFSVQYPSTVHVDAKIAYNKCLDEIRELIGSENLEKADKYASSSAAGGLRIAVIGLTESLSIAAGRNAAFGAGGKIVNLSIGEIRDEDIDEILNSEAEIILFCGGYEGGNESILLENAQKIGRSDINCPIIYGGNSKIDREIAKIFAGNNKKYFIVPNIIPEIGKINVEATEDIIRDLFMEQITYMKGISEIVKEMNAPIKPTPVAVLSAGELLSKGTSKIDGLGELAIVDIGGATTDIHSYSKNIPYKGSKQIGAQEPYKKRTVEGDLGMRESAGSVVSDYGLSSFSKELDLEEDEIDKSIKIRLENTKFIPKNSREKIIDKKLAEASVNLAMRRHAGYIEQVYGSGFKYIQYGKNLENIRTIIGTGGIIINNENPVDILKNTERRSKKDKHILLPEKCSYFLDREYILYSAGLLRDIDENLAMNVMIEGIFDV